MDETKLKEANEILSKIKNFDNLINHFVDNDGINRHSQGKSVEALTDFFNKSRNLTGYTDLEQLARNLIDVMVSGFISQRNRLVQQFKDF